MWALGRWGWKQWGRKREANWMQSWTDYLTDYVGLDLSTPFSPYLLTMFLQVNNSVFTYPMTSLFIRPLLSACMPLPLLVAGFPCGSAGKESACNVGDLGSIPGLGRSPGEGSGYPLQYSGLQNPMDCVGHGVSKTQTQLSAFHFHYLLQV